MLFGRIAIPQAVCDELRHDGAPADVRAWATAIPDWIDVHPVPSHDLDARLGPGERDAMALAQHLGAQAVLLDDGKARRAAEARGLVVLGTLAVLTRAAGRGLVDLASAVDRLRGTSFRASPALLRLVLEKDRPG